MFVKYSLEDTSHVCYMRVAVQVKVMAEHNVSLLLYSGRVPTPTGNTLKRNAHNRASTRNTMAVGLVEPPSPSHVSVM